MVVKYNYTDRSKYIQTRENMSQPLYEGKVWIEIDKSWITLKDKGIYTSIIEFQDSEHDWSFQKSYEELEIEIVYTIGKILYDPVEYYRLKNLKIIEKRLQIEKNMNKLWFNWFTSQVISKSQIHIVKYPSTKLVDQTIPAERKSILVDKQIFQNEMKLYKNQIKAVQLKQTKDHLPVEIEIKQITQNGQIMIEFNQKLMIPPFSKLTQQKNLNKTPQKRRLQDYTDFDRIDVGRDIFQFKYRLRNNIDVEGVQYYLRIKEWTNYNMILEINFQYPRNISKFDAFDHVIIKVIEPYMFVSYETGISIKKNYRLLQESIPKQFGTQINTSILEINAFLFLTSFRIITLILVFYNLFFGYSIRDLWQLLYILQVICYIQKSDVYFPITAGIFIEQLTSIIQFDIVNPLWYLQLFDRQFRFDKFIFNEPWSQTLRHKDQQRSYLNDYFFILFWGSLIFITFWIFKLIKRKVKSQRIKEIIRKFNWFVDNQLYFNGFIRIYTVFFLMVCFSCFEQIDMWVKKSKYQGIYAQITTSILALFILLTFLYIMYLLIKYRTVLGFHQNRKVFQNLYEEVHLYRNPQNVWFMPIFLARRIIFASIPYTLPQLVGSQLSLFMYISLFYFMWYAYFLPHEDINMMRLELFNQFMILVLTYVCLMFTEWNVFEYSFNDVGTFFVSIVCTIIIVNLCFILQKAWVAWFLYQRLRRRQERWIEFLDRRRYNLEFNRVVDEHNRLVIEHNPFKNKPKIKRQDKIPQYYTKSISYKMSEKKFEKFQKLTQKNVFKSPEEVEKIISYTIFKELGDFGEIVELARQDILKDYCQPLQNKNKIVYKGEIVKKVQIDPLPPRMQPFEITFDKSSKNRWDAYYSDYYKPSKFKKCIERCDEKFNNTIQKCLSKFQKSKKQDQDKYKDQVTQNQDEKEDLEANIIDDSILIDGVGHLNSKKAIKHLENIQKDKNNDMVLQLPIELIKNNLVQKNENEDESTTNEKNDLKLKNQIKNRKDKQKIHNQKQKGIGDLINEEILEVSDEDSEMFIEDYESHEFHGFEHKTLGDMLFNQKEKEPSDESEEFEDELSINTDDFNEYSSVTNKSTGNSINSMPIIRHSKPAIIKSHKLRTNTMSNQQLCLKNLDLKPIREELFEDSIPQSPKQKDQSQKKKENSKDLLNIDASIVQSDEEALSTKSYRALKKEKDSNSQSQFNTTNQLSCNETDKNKS